jgi:hypothetical protein
MPDEKSVKTNLIFWNVAKMLGWKHDEFHPSSAKLWWPSPTKSNVKTRQLGLENNCKEARPWLLKKGKNKTKI